MSNNNIFWGRRSGTIYKDGSNAFPQQQWGSGKSRDGKGIIIRFHYPLPAKIRKTSKIDRRSVLGKGR